MGEAKTRSASQHTGLELGFTLEDLDHDGAIVEGIAAVYGDSRAAFLRKAFFGGAALLAGLAAPPADAANSRKRDVSTLKFDLVFEYLQSDFYVGAVREGTVARMRPEKERWARVLGAHEIAHVEILKSVLGGNAVSKPFFNFRGVTESESAFTETAVAMEDLTVALLPGRRRTFTIASWSRLHSRCSQRRRGMLHGRGESRASCPWRTPLTSRRRLPRSTGSFAPPASSPPDHARAAGGGPD